MKNKLWILYFFLAVNSLVNAQIYPVYFADVIKENNKDILHFEWRPDYRSYDKAIITDEIGQVLGEVKYPQNIFNIKNSQEQKILFVTAVGTNGEKSEPVKVDFNKDYSSLYASGPAEQIIIKKQRGENARFVGAQSGHEFIAKGVNFCGIRLADHDSFEPDITATRAHVKRVKRINSNPAKALHDVKLGDQIQFYDVFRTETLMRTIKAKGYNLVRVFIKTGGRSSDVTNIRGMSGPKDTKGLYGPYMDNFIDFLTTAQKYGIYVMPCFTENEMMDNNYFKALAKGADKQGILFSEDGIKAKQHYIALFLQYIKEKDPILINSLYALTMQNEFAFHSDEAPFNQTSGTYTFIDDTSYDMTNDVERRALANVAIQNYFSKMKKTVEANAPGLLVGEGTFSMGAVGKTYDNSKGIRTIEGNNDLRFPMTAVEYLNTDIDFLDFHVYRWGAKGTGTDVFKHFAENMKLLTPEAKELMKSKPIIMGEFGSFIFDETTLDESIIFVKELNDAALDFGFKGSAYWTIDTFVQTRLWNLMWENGKMLDAFSNE
ncbi:MAG: hypothetical protein ACI8YC_000015 [Salibacteraceae bacterium]|jgi:hypothetical protein